MRKNILQHIGAIVSGRRNEEHLTQQQLAQQTGRGLRHIQNIETGRVNASIEVLADIIYRLGLSADVSYPEMPKIEQQANLQIHVKPQNEKSRKDFSKGKKGMTNQAGQRGIFANRLSRTIISG